LTELAHNSSHRGAAVVSAMGMACVLALLLAAPLANAQGAMQNDDQREGTTNALPTILNKVGVSQNLNHQLPLDTTFTDETGKTVKLGDYFGSKPAVMAMVYYQCPMLCSEEMDGVTSALEMVRYQPGKDYNVIFISIDPSETPAMAAQKKALYMHRYGRPETAGGWHYLVGTEPNIEVRAHQRDCDSDAAGETGAVLFRGGVFAEGHFVCAGPGLGREGGVHCRGDRVVLLPLRSAHWALHDYDREDYSASVPGHGGLPRYFHVPDVPAGSQRQICAET
jgi:cytochrome oxidase Cu insertion factor (SCO1/SenC/PrrC family)